MWHNAGYCVLVVGHAGLSLQIHVAKDNLTRWFGGEIAHAALGMTCRYSSPAGEETKSRDNRGCSAVGAETQNSQHTDTPMQEHTARNQRLPGMTATNMLAHTGHLALGLQGQRMVGCVSR